MRPISDYTIYCTLEQTKKALELGAPIKEADKYDFPVFMDSHKYYVFPTAEQLIGWIEGISIIQLQIEKQMGESGTRYRIWVRDECKPFSEIIKMYNYPTRKEATLAAIDAALDYLIENKK